MVFDNNSAIVIGWKCKRLHISLSMIMISYPIFSFIFLKTNSMSQKKEDKKKVERHS